MAKKVDHDKVRKASTLRMRKALYKDVHMQEVKDIECIALDKGYYEGRTIVAGKKFLYSGPLKNGRFPAWCEPCGKHEDFESEFDKLEGHEVEEEDLDLSNEEGTAPAQKASKKKVSKKKASKKVSKKVVVNQDLV